MASPYIAEIRIVGFNFPPIHWAFCNGQLMPISQNTALFSLIGTFYGGDGKSTFGLPNFQGMAPMHQGQGPGLSLRSLGETAGVPQVTLLSTEVPAHTHQFSAAASDGRSNVNVSTANDPCDVDPTQTIYSNGQANVPMGILPSNGAQPHENMMPYLVLNFIIALQGVFPPRG